MRGALFAGGGGSVVLRGCVRARCVLEGDVSGIGGELNGTDVLLRTLAFACALVTAVVYGTPVCGDEVGDEKGVCITSMPWHEAVTNPV